MKLRSFHDNEVNLSGFEAQFTDDEHELSSAMQDPYLELVSNESAPLLLSQVDSDTCVLPHFKEVVSQFGWPSMLESGDIQPCDGSMRVQGILYRSFAFGVKKAICRNLASRISYKFYGDSQLRQMNLTQATIFQNLLYCRMFIEHMQLHKSFLVLYRKELDSMYNQYDGSGDDDDVMYEAVMKKDELCKAVYMAYRIIGRLMLLKDHEAAFGEQSSQSAITSVDDELLIPQHKQ